ncbi:hypothetical protein RRG08_047299 [Elysia crispata]|uniref:Uncharacterized protein n=1 Tax=Elysia crispata TaxID=231223 RepID=A0AAE0YZA4_9GAST|nr:hypothetical protein RRG08_047299 [Elysia crispata]
MATGMDPSVYDVKEKVMDDLEKQFNKKLNNFTADAKTKMRSFSREAAIQVFELTLVFLTQAFPDLSRLESASDNIQDETMKLREDFEKLERTLSQKLKDAQQSFSEKLEDTQNSLSKTIDLNKAKESHTHEIRGLGKLQKLLCDKTKISQTMGATAPSTTLASASAVATPPGPPESLSHRSTFSVRSSSDAHIPNIYDMKLLPGGLVVFADGKNKCVKLYDWQGCHIHNRALDSFPLFMTVIDLSSGSGWDLCVTLWEKSEIALLGVTPKGVKIKTPIKTSRKYRAIAAVSTRTLAVGYLSGAGIDLIDLSGNILYKLSSVLDPLSMVTTEDQCLLMSLCNNSIAKLKMEDHSTIFSCKVKQVEHPKGVAYSMGGYFFVSDGHKRTLHLIDQDADLKKGI